MPKRILIISDGFTPPLYGVRMTQLCKYLNLDGWDITLVTEQIAGDNYIVPHCRFLAMPYYSQSPFLHQIQWLSDKLFSRKEHCLYRFAKQNIRLEDFTLILCSTFNLFPLLTAAKLAREAGIPLIADLRDITEQWNADSYLASNIHLPHKLKRWLVNTYEHKCIRQRNTILRTADAITTISPWHQRLLQSINPNTHLIYNGFDPEIYTTTSVRTSQYIISYIGRLYDFHSRNPQLFLEAVKELHRERQINSSFLHIEFHIEHDMVIALQERVDQLGLQDYFHISGYIRRKDALSLLQHSAISLLFVAAPSLNAPQGVMTTKFFEALGCEKPILCVPSDEGCLAQTIRETNAGIATSDIEEIKAFILDKYHEWQQNGYTHQPVTNKEQFSRRRQAEQFEQLFLSLTEGHQRPLLTDICWTLYRSNTTFDFLDSIIAAPRYRRMRHFFTTRFGKYINLLLLKVFHIDLQRTLALRYTRHWDKDTLLDKARTFCSTYLEPRKNEEVFRILQGRQIILASGTMDAIAQAVAEQLQPTAVHSSHLLKHHLLDMYCDFDIITDNTADLPLIRKAHHAYIVVYDDLPRWKKLTKDLQNTEFIYADGTKY